MEKPNFLWSMFTMKCPRCRRGRMFSDPNAWNLRRTMKMPEKCPECGSSYLIEKFLKAGPVAQCPNKDCGYKHDVEAAPEPVESHVA